MAYSDFSRLIKRGLALDNEERYPLYVNETELAMLAVGLELIGVHQLFTHCQDEKEQLQNRLAGLLVP